MMPNSLRKHPNHSLNQLPSKVDNSKLTIDFSGRNPQTNRPEPSEYANVSGCSCNRRTNYRWITAKKDALCVCQMKTSHLFFSLRMLWNNLMPDPVPDNPRFYDLSGWRRKYIEQSLKYIMSELVTRDLSAKQINQLRWMQSKLQEYRQMKNPRIASLIKYLTT